MTYSTVEDLAQAMLDIIERDGWRRTVLEDKSGKVCLVGALGKAWTGNSADGYSLAGSHGGYDEDYFETPLLCLALRNRLIAAIEHRMGREFLGSPETALWRFNDAYAESVDDVKAVLQEVIDQKT